VRAVEKGYTISVDVVNSTCTDKELFVYNRIATDAGYIDKFSHVATPSDLVEYPAVPGSEGTFRQSQVTLVFRDLALLAQSLKDMKKDFYLLAESLNQMDNLREEIVVING
jgi:hypothetical protein